MRCLLGNRSPTPMPRSCHEYEVTPNRPWAGVLCLALIVAGFVAACFAEQPDRASAAVARILATPAVLLLVGSMVGIRIGRATKRFVSDVAASLLRALDEERD